MSYTAAIDELKAMGPELLTQPGRPRRKFSLAEISVLLGAMGNPHLRFRSVLIAGTNGKGSTAATLASILTQAGLRTGLYTSPHLERVNERIRVGGAEISDDDFARRYHRVHETAAQLIEAGKLAEQPSFFETLTAMAFEQFAEEKVDIAVLEVGMGGRLDATNVVNPLLSIVTDISLDHTEWLGPTIAAISREKAGIMRRGGVLVTLPQHPDANQVLGEIAMELGVRGASAVSFMPPGAACGSYRCEVLGEEIEVASPLLGVHQHRNVALAIAAAVELAEHDGLPITPMAIGEGIRKTVWPGRLERVVRGETEWILDVAHNPAGAWALRAGLRDAGDKDVSQYKCIVFSCLKDKPLAELGQILFPVFEHVVLVPISSPRATPMKDLLECAHATGASAIAAESVGEALQVASRIAGAGPVVVSGSVYLVGEARGLLMSDDWAANRECK